MEIRFAGQLEEVEIAVCCNRGIFSDDPNKVGSVFIFGGSGREVLSLVERALMLYSEYPEECREAELEEGVEVSGDAASRLEGTILLVAKQGSGTVVVFDRALDHAAIHEAFGRLKRYATRLTRMDVP